MDNYNGNYDNMNVNYNQDMNNMYQQPQKQGYGFGLASLICGIVSIVTCCTFYGALILGLAAIILGIVSISRHESMRGMPIAGIIMGILMLIFSAGILYIVIANPEWINEYMDIYQNQNLNHEIVQIFPKAM